MEQMNQKLTTDPCSIQNAELYKLMPDLSAEDHQALKEDIRKRGVMIPVEVDEDGNILDGHARIKAWEELCAEGVQLDDYPVITRNGMSKLDKRAYIRAINLSRRHLNQKQKRDLIKEQIKETRNMSICGVAKKLKVSPSTVSSVRDSLEKEDGIKSEYSVCSDGRRYPHNRKTSFRPNKKDVIETAIVPTDSDLWHSVGTMPEKQAQEYEYAIEHETIHITGNSVEPDLRCGDYSSVLDDIAPGSVSLMITELTDSPDYLQRCDKLGRYAVKKLVEGGMLVVYASIAHLHEAMAAFDKHLRYDWFIPVIRRGLINHVDSRNVDNMWQAVIVYYKPPFKRNTSIEDLWETVRTGDSGHDWQQSIKDQLHFVETFSAPGDTVVDPLMSSGVNAIACLSRDRKFTGCAANTNALDDIRQQIQDVRKPQDDITDEVDNEMGRVGQDLDYEDPSELVDKSNRTV